VVVCSIVLLKQALSPGSRVLVAAGIAMYLAYFAFVMPVWMRG